MRLWGRRWRHPTAFMAEAAERDLERRDTRVASRTDNS